MKCTRRVKDIRGKTLRTLMMAIVIPTIFLNKSDIKKNRRARLASFPAGVEITK